MKRFIVLVPALVLMFTACADQTETKAGGDAGLRITGPASGSSVKGNVVSLDVSAPGITIVKADGDTSGRTGHYHVFIDRDPVAEGAAIPKEPGIVHSADDPIAITGLSVGRHRFTVILGNGAHIRVGSAKAETTVTVEGPSVAATAPATVKAGEPVMLQMKVDGVTLVKADRDTSGRTGHLHVFVDREPTPSGQAIPQEPGVVHTNDTSVSIPGLAAGEHVIWVVLGDGNHLPFAPRVGDKITVTVQ